MAGSARACWRCFPTEAAAGEAAALLQAQDFFDGCQVLGVAAVPEQDWVRLTQSQFAPVEITPEFWIVPTWHEPPAQAKTGHPARSGPGLRHRHPPDHAHVPALDRAPRQPTGPGPRAGLRLRFRHSGHWCGQVRCDRTSMRSTSTRRRCSPRVLNAEANDVHAARGLAGAGPAASTRPCWPTSWRRRSRCWRRCCARMWRPVVRWCWPASWSGRPTS